MSEGNRSKHLDAAVRAMGRHLESEAKAAATARKRRNARINKLGVVGLTLMERGDEALIDRLEAGAKSLFADRPRDRAVLGLDDGDSFFDELREQAVLSKAARDSERKTGGGSRPAAASSGSKTGSHGSSSASTAGSRPGTDGSTASTSSGAGQGNGGPRAPTANA